MSDRLETALVAIAVLLLLLLFIESMVARQRDQTLSRRLDVLESNRKEARHEQTS